MSVLFSVARPGGWEKNTEPECQQDMRRGELLHTQILKNLMIHSVLQVNLDVTSQA